MIAHDVEYLRCIKCCWYKLKWNLIPNHWYKFNRNIKRREIYSQYFISNLQYGWNGVIFINITDRSA